MLIFLSRQAMKRGHQGHFSSGAVRPDVARVHLLVTAHHKNEAYRYMYVLLPPENFEKLLSGDDEASLEVGLKSWCVVTCKLE